jgi:predicted DsbA family dithiol-disulfide isomerase
MKVEIWSDVICPWCYIGKRRFERALERFEHRGEVEIVHRSFELDPNAPARRQGDYNQHLARKYGMTLDQASKANDRLSRMAAEEGLEYHLESARPGNTFDAHRLVHLAAQHGSADELMERLYRAYFTDSEPIGDHEALRELALEIGLPDEEVRELLAGDRFAAEVRADEEEASTLGITAVPSFVVGRAALIPGAQDVETILAILNRAWAKTHPAPEPAAGLS